MFLTIHFHDWAEFIAALSDSFGMAISHFTTPIFYRIKKDMARERHTFTVVICTTDKRYLFNAVKDTPEPFVQMVRDLKHVANQKNIPVYVGEIVSEPDEVMKH